MSIFIQKGAFKAKFMTQLNQIKQANQINISIAYAPTAKTHVLFALIIEAQSTPMHALLTAKAEGHLTQIDEADIMQQKLSIGVFGKKIAFDDMLAEGDRLEIYRDLTLDPMSKRKLISKSKKRN